jgi:pentatricopeptide repeat protein
MKMGKVSATFSVIMIPFMPRCEQCNAGLGRLEDGRLVHKQLIQSGYKSDAFVCNSLVDMYAKCGSIEEAWTVFEKMPS